MLRGVPVRTFDPVFTLTNCRRWRSLAGIRMLVRDLSISIFDCQGLLAPWALLLPSGLRIEISKGRKPRRILMSTCLCYSGCCWGSSCDVMLLVFGPPRSFVHSQTG